MTDQLQMNQPRVLKCVCGGLHQLSLLPETTSNTDHDAVRLGGSTLVSADTSEIDAFGNAFSLNPTAFSLVKNSWRGCDENSQNNWTCKHTQNLNTGTCTCKPQNSQNSAPVPVSHISFIKQSPSHSGSVYKPVPHYQYPVLQQTVTQPNARMRDTFVDPLACRLATTYPLNSNSVDQSESLPVMKPCHSVAQNSERELQSGAPHIYQPSWTFTSEGQRRLTSEGQPPLSFTGEASRAPFCMTRDERSSVMDKSIDASYNVSSPSCPRAIQSAIHLQGCSRPPSVRDDVNSDYPVTSKPVRSTENINSHQHSPYSDFFVNQERDKFYLSVCNAKSCGERLSPTQTIANIKEWNGEHKWKTDRFSLNERKYYSRKGFSIQNLINPSPSKSRKLNSVSCSLVRQAACDSYSFLTAEYNKLSHQNFEPAARLRMQQFYNDSVKKYENAKIENGHIFKSINNRKRSLVTKDCGINNCDTNDIDPSKTDGNVASFEQCRESKAIGGFESDKITTTIIAKRDCESQTDSHQFDEPFQGRGEEGGDRGEDEVNVDNKSINVSEKASVSEGKKARIRTSPCGSDGNVNTDESENTTKPMQCKICIKYIPDEVALKLHEETHALSTRKKKFHCQCCNRWFQCKQNYEVHCESKLHKKRAKNKKTPAEDPD